MNIYNLRALWDQITNPAILGEILGKNHALKIDPQEENKKRTAW